ncbi:hypothetical protein ACN28I_42645 [Archangium gephyra]|uniref:hypothetical protein n=1 Tax=Archangium gephyra TaxID=48 RepID=UPI003B7CE1D4
MSNKHRSLAVGEGGGTQLEARRRSWDEPWMAVRLVVLVLLALQTACATGHPLGGNLGVGRQRWRVQRPPPGPQENKGHTQAAPVTGAHGADEDLESADTGADVTVVASAAEGPVEPRQARHRARRARALGGRTEWATDGPSRCP